MTNATFCENEALLTQMKRFVMMSQRAGVNEKPKHHLSLEMVLRVPKEGNCSLHATWRDEGLNRQLGNLGRMAHAKVFYARVLSLWENSQEHLERTKRRRTGA